MGIACPPQEAYGDAPVTTVPQSNGKPEWDLDAYHGAKYLPWLQCKRPAPEDYPIGRKWGPDVGVILSSSASTEKEGGGPESR